MPLKKAPPSWQKDLEDAVCERLIHGNHTDKHPYAARMSELVESFPCLRAKHLPGTRPWDAIAFAEAAFLNPGGLSHGETCAAAFVLKVWNVNFPCPDFDFFDAMGVWDLDNRASFFDWVAAPFWP